MRWPWGTGRGVVSPAMFDRLLETLTEAEQRELLASMRRRKLKKGDVLFWEGDPADAAFVIDRGHLIVERTTEMGDVVAVAVVGRGDLVGEQALLADDPRTATARAVTPTEIRVISRSGFDRLRVDHPDFDRLLIELLDQRLRDISELLMDARHRQAEDRVRRAIAQLHELFGDEIPLSQETVASLAGTTRPTVNGIVGAMEADGVLAVSRGRLRITDASLL